MQRRRTTIGRGAFGRTVSTDEHAAETLGRILRRGRPLTEDALFLWMHHVLRRDHASRVYQKVSAAKALDAATAAQDTLVEVLHDIHALREAIREPA